MNNLAHIIQSLEVPKGNLAMFWLGQAGYVFKTSSNQLIYLDIYLSNMCESLPGGGMISKRIMPSPLSAEDITNGLMAYPNLIGLTALSKVVVEETKRFLVVVKEELAVN